MCEYSQNTIIGGIVSDSYSDYGYVCSPMNYIGGKYKLLSQLLPLFPTHINCFVDLFCGGCNVGLNSHARSFVFNDNLSYLIDLYTEFYNRSTEDIIQYVESRIQQYGLSLTNEEGYKALRVEYNTNRNPLDLFVLVAYSFNHQIRFNNSHQFNNPFGKERSCFNANMKRNLYAFLYKLKRIDISFSKLSFDEFCFEKLTSQDFVYCDPPYLITTGTYNDGKRGFTGWGDKQEKTLLEILSMLNKNNIKFGLSNVLLHKGKTNQLLIRWIEDNGFYVTHINNNYSNSSYNTINRDKTSTDEVLITNYIPNIQPVLL